MECDVANGNGVAVPLTVFYMPIPNPEKDEPVNVGIMIGAGDDGGMLVTWCVPKR